MRYNMGKTRLTSFFSFFCILGHDFLHLIFIPLLGYKESLFTSNESRSEREKVQRKVKTKYQGVKNHLGDS